MAARLIHSRRLTAPFYSSLGRTRSISTDSRGPVMIDRSTLPTSAICLFFAACTAWISNKQEQELSDTFRKVKAKIIGVDDEFRNATETLRSIDPKNIPTELFPELLHFLREKIVTISRARQDLVSAQNFSMIEALPEKYRQDPVFSEDRYEDSRDVHL